MKPGRITSLPFIAGKHENLSGIWTYLLWAVIEQLHTDQAKHDFIAPKIENKRLIFPIQPQPPTISPFQMLMGSE